MDVGGIPAEPGTAPMVPGQRLSRAWSNPVGACVSRGVLGRVLGDAGRPGAHGVPGASLRPKPLAAHRDEGSSRRAACSKGCYLNPSINHISWDLLLVAHTQVRPSAVMFGITPFFHNSSLVPSGFRR